jgi:membrane protein implicated in regulation of membrane protease activity
MRFILFMIIVCLLFWLVEKLLNKWLGKNNRKISDTDGRMLDHRGKVSSFSSLLSFILTKVQDM